MLSEILIAILVGVSCGIFTGLTPGVHVNLVASLMISFSPALLSRFPPVVLAVFIIAMSVTHTFLDNIPSIFLGAPNEATALGVLPGHRYLLKGYGLMAVKLALVGSFGAVILSLALFPLFILILRYGYPAIQNTIGYLLIATAVLMVIRDTRKVWALTIFLLSGFLGMAVFRIPSLANPLLPMLSGMFGIATLLLGFREQNRIPAQKVEQRIKIRRGVVLKALISGQFSGFLTAVLPGLSSGIAAILSLQFVRKLGDHGFMVLIGSIGTVNFVLSMAALFVMDKARNGSVVAVQQLIGALDLPMLLVFLATVLIASGISVWLTLRIGRTFSSLANQVDYRKLVFCIIVFVAALVSLSSGLVGILVLTVSTAIGMLPPLTKVTRTHAMGCILLPVILSFF